MKKKFAFIVSSIVGIFIFIAWMSMVGSPHVVETGMGFAISLGVALWLNYKICPWDI